MKVKSMPSGTDTRGAISGRDLLCSLAAGVVALALYVATLQPDLGGPEDTPKFQFLGYVLGTAHPPGYPLYVLLSHVFVKLPIGTIAYRANLFSAVMAALACGMAYLIGRQIGAARWFAFCAALGLATGASFWRSAVFAEVYSLAAVMGALGTSLLLAWGARGGAGLLLGAVAALSLGAGNHLTIVGLVPPFVLYVLVRNRRALTARVIGAAAAIMFAKAGSHVIINYRTDDQAAGQVQRHCIEFGVKSMLAKADISNRAEVDAMVTTVIAEFGRIDVLVNNAGIWEHNPIDGMDDTRLKRALYVNILGTFYPTMAVVPHMKRQRSGNIILISSTAGQRGEAFHSPYAATKGAIISLTKSLAPELIEYNIRVNCVAPGWVDTDMSHDALIGPERADILSKIPMGRAGTAEELAGPILFLASDLSTFITGEILNVNGGAVLCG